ncbi:SWIM zinc finger family protein [Mariniflexile sp.]|uniref:SWIM zinc finger family protein n=1 Tax=Mariniflexile sp. TaxID=1979402 RepID=UPI004048409A
MVYGSQKYAVYLINEAGELHFNCNCPYGHEGICKHLVAFALTIIDGNYKEAGQDITPTLSENEFKSRYSKIPSKKKLLFLKQLLDRDHDLRQQFMAFSDDKTEKPDTIIGEKIEDVKFGINAKLSNIDLDNLCYDYDNYNHDYGYRDYWEVEYDAAIDEIKREMDPYISSITDYIKKGNLLDAIRILLGLYEGVQNLPDLDNDNCIFDGEYNNEVQAILNVYMCDISKAISNIVASDKAVLEIITLIFERISFYNNQNLSEGKEEINYSIKEFELLFQTLVINNGIAHFLYQKIQENKLESLAAAYILLNIAKVADNEKLWKETAETYAGLDAKIAKQLLEKYDSKNAVSDFNRIAKMAFNNWADEFDKYLVDHLDP